MEFSELARNVLFLKMCILKSYGVGDEVGIYISGNCVFTCLCGQ